LLICLVYFTKHVPMDTGKGNIIRSICRSLEILLFFLISVVCFNVLVKTTSQNTKSKSKDLSGGIVAPRGLSVPGNSRSLHYGLERINGFFSSQTNQLSSSLSLHSGIPPFPDILHDQHLFLKQPVSNRNNNDLSIASHQHKPDNLLQQNPVLLI